MIAIASDKGMVSEHFGHCLEFALFETDKGQIVNVQLVGNPGHKPGYLPVFLHEKGVSVIISGGMGAGAIEIFNDKGIEVVTGASGRVREVAEQYLKGQLPSTGSVCNQHQHRDTCESE